MTVQDTRADERIAQALRAIRRLKELEPTAWHRVWVEHGSDLPFVEAALVSVEADLAAARDEADGLRLERQRALEKMTAAWQAARSEAELKGIGLAEAECDLEEQRARAERAELALSTALQALCEIATSERVDPLTKLPISTDEARVAAEALAQIEGGGAA